MCGVVGLGLLRVELLDQMKLRLTQLQVELGLGLTLAKISGCHFKFILHIPPLNKKQKVIGIESYIFVFYHHPD
jgi:hypothetical protein